VVEVFNPYDRACVDESLMVEELIDREKVVWCEGKLKQSRMKIYS